MSSHDPNPNPFSLDQHKHKRLAYQEAIERATTQRGVVSYTTSANLLRNEGLPLEKRKAIYNLTQKAQKGARLTSEEEVQAVLSTLEDHGFHAQVRHEHCINSDGERICVRVVSTRQPLETLRST